MRNLFSRALIILTCTVAAACSSTYTVSKKSSEKFKKSNIEPSKITGQIPDYQDTLHRVSGKGKAIVSEPGNSDRVTVYFSGNRDSSKVTIKNRIGIEGGQMLADRDSILIYNSVDKVARKITIQNAYSTNLDGLASINILDMLNYRVHPQNIQKVFEGPSQYLLITDDQTELYVDKTSYHVMEVVKPAEPDTPYGRIIYNAYGSINGYELPRKITIFSADRGSKVSLLVQSLEINPKHIDLSIEIPDKVTVQRK